MIRVVLYLVLVGLLAAAAAWLAERPGDVVITWQNQRVETSVMVLVCAVAALVLLAVMIWSMLRAIIRSPDMLWLHLRTRRGVRGYLALSQGLIAIGTGDARAARRLADEASRIAPDEPLTLLLAAQAAQLAGDRVAAERTFHLMASRDDTRLFGLHGLYIEAQRRDDHAGALVFAEEAAKSAAVPPWAGQAVFEFRCAAGDWTGALDRLDRNMRAGLVDRATCRRQRAVLLTARALGAVEQRDRDSARALALDAISFSPTLVPAAVLAARLVAAAGDPRRAAKIVETAWQANPHPDLADTYIHLQPGISARERLLRMQSLADKAPGHIEAALAVARAAIDASEFAIARRALAPLLVLPTQRVAVLMAEIEELDRGDEGRAREWMTRALHARHDPAWTADGLVSERWMPVSPVSGRLDAFQWKEPLAEIAGGENGNGRSRALVPVPRARADAETDGRLAPAAGTPELSETASPSVSDFPETSPGRGAGRAVASARTRAGAPDRIIPLTPVPDDPGPEPELVVEPETEPPPAPKPKAWVRLRGLFN